jgi:hypothetical protein
MTPEDYQWRIDLVKARHNGLNLTFGQAEQIYMFEEDAGIYSDKYHFSAWEQWDYELSAFGKILNPEQFVIFGKHIQDAVENYQQSLIEQDKEDLKEIEFHKQTIKYYEEEFLPDFFKDPLISTFSWLSSDSAKIEFLKAEYKKFLNDAKMRILTDHFRQNRTFKPNGLEVSLLQHKVSYLWPNYYAFREQMDEPTKTIAAYLKQKLRSFQEQYDEFTESKLKALKVFNKENFDKYHDGGRGWHVVITSPNNPEEEKEYRVMCLLLLDREKYGCYHPS